MQAAVSLDGIRSPRVCTLLAESGEIRTPVQSTFWSPCFGVLIDRFGIPSDLAQDSRHSNFLRIRRASTSSRAGPSSRRTRTLSLATWIASSLSSFRCQKMGFRRIDWCLWLRQFSRRSPLTVSRSLLKPTSSSHSRRHWRSCAG